MGRRRGRLPGVCPRHSHARPPPACTNPADQSHPRKQEEQRGKKGEKKKIEIKKKTREAVAHMASGQEPLPPPASASSALPASQPCLALEHPLGSGPRGSQGEPPRWGRWGAGWSPSALLEASGDLVRGGRGRRDNRLLCSYLWRPEVGWGFGLQISNQCSLFLPVDWRPWRGSLAGSQGQGAGGRGGGERSELPMGVSRAVLGLGGTVLRPHPKRARCFCCCRLRQAGFVPAAWLQTVPSIFRFFEH